MSQKALFVLVSFLVWLGPGNGRTAGPKWTFCGRSTADYFKPWGCVCRKKIRLFWLLRQTDYSAAHWLEKHELNFWKSRVIGQWIVKSQVVSLRLHIKRVAVSPNSWIKQRVIWRGSYMDSEVLPVRWKPLLSVYSPVKVMSWKIKSLRLVGKGNV